MIKWQNQSEEIPISLRNNQPTSLFLGPRFKRTPCFSHPACLGVATTSTASFIMRFLKKYRVTHNSFEISIHHWHSGKILKSNLKTAIYYHHKEKNWKWAFRDKTFSKIVFIFVIIWFLYIKFINKFHVEIETWVIRITSPSFLSSSRSSAAT